MAIVDDWVQAYTYTPWYPYPSDRPDEKFPYVVNSYWWRCHDLDLTDPLTRGFILFAIRDRFLLAYHQALMPIDKQGWVSVFYPPYAPTFYSTLQLTQTQFFYPYLPMTQAVILRKVGNSDYERYWGFTKLGPVVRYLVSGGNLNEFGVNLYQSVADLIALPIVTHGGYMELSIPSWKYGILEPAKGMFCNARIGTLHRRRRPKYRGDGFYPWGVGTPPP